MSTSKFLVLLFLLLTVFSGVALRLKSGEAPSGKIPLVWVTDNNPARTRQIEAFNRENGDLHLTIDYANSGIQKIILQCSSGVGPDIFDVYNSDELQAYVEAGVVWDITEQSRAGGFDALGPNLWPGMRENVEYLGKQYSYPCNNAVNLLIYNKNVFDYLGLPYPQGLMTWDQFIELGIQIRSRGKSVPPLYAVTGLDWGTFFYGLGGEFFTGQGGLRVMDSPELLQALQLHKDMLYKHRLTPSSLDLKAMSGQGGWGSGALNQFSAGRFAMAVSGEWALLAFGRTYQRQMEDLEARGLKPSDIKNPLERPLRLGCVPLPVFEGLRHYGMGGRMAAINAKSPHREQALKFLQYLAGPAYAKILNESADNLPGNPQYSNLGIEPGPEALGRVAMHEATVEGMQYGYSMRKSPFLLSSDVGRVMKDQVSRLESNPDIEVKELLRSAQAELDSLLRRNLAHDPGLRKIYLERFGALP